MLLLLGFAIGMCAGLRSMTPPAVVAWAARYRWPHLQQSHLAFVAAPVTPYVLTALACAELIADKLPFIPSRLAPGPLTGRILAGGLCGAVLCAAAHQSPAAGALAGGMGGVAGAFAGYHVRRELVTRLGLPDVAVALIEDVVAVGGTVFIVWRV